MEIKKFKFFLKKLKKDPWLRQIIIKGSAKLNLAIYVFFGNIMPVKKYAQIDETAAHNRINWKLLSLARLIIWKFNKLIINNIQLTGIIENPWFGKILLIKKTQR